MPFAGVSQGPKNATLRHAMRGALDAVARMMGDQHAEQARGLQTGPASAMGEEPAPKKGTALDYMFSKLGVQRAFLLEVYQAPSLSVRRALLAREPRMDMAAAALLETAAGSTTSPEAPVKEHFAGEKGLALLADDPTASFDCISTFNPTRQAEYEKVVAAWTDALLVLVNQSTVPL